MAVLYVVATPIGNLQDFSPRGIETLKQSDLILAEDTRVTMKLAQVFGFHARMVRKQSAVDCRADCRGKPDGFARNGRRDTLYFRSRKRSGTCLQ